MVNYIFNYTSFIGHRTFNPCKNEMDTVDSTILAASTCMILRFSYIRVLIFTLHYIENYIIYS